MKRVVKIGFPPELFGMCHAAAIVEYGFLRFRDWLEQEEDCTRWQYPRPAHSEPEAAL